jgi:hypothetical protein
MVFQIRSGKSIERPYVLASINGGLEAATYQQRKQNAAFLK